MKYALVIGGIVTQVQTDPDTNFVEVEDTVKCGMIQNPDGTFSIPSLSLEVINDSMEKKINDEAQLFINKNMPSYPSFEMLTFDKQETEARAYLADSSIATPVLTPIAAERGLTIADLAAKVIIKADAFTALTASVAGQRQKYQDQRAAAYTNGDVNGISTINPTYTAPTA